jgi:hypothetical protein
MIFVKKIPKRAMVVAEHTLAWSPSLYNVSKLIVKQNPHFGSGATDGIRQISLLSNKGLLFPLTTLNYLGYTMNQTSKKGIYFLTHFHYRAKTDVRRYVRADPLPDRFVGIEIRAIGRQRNQPKLQFGRAQVGADRLSTMGRSIVPNHNQWSWKLFPQRL